MPARLVLFVAAAILFCGLHNTTFAQTFTIGGKVTEPPSVTGTPIPNVSITMTLNGSTQMVTQTDATGSFSFANIAAGSNYQVVATKTNFTFNPSSHGGTNLSTNQTLFFTGTSSGASSTVQFASANINAGEATGSLAVTINRSGDTTAAATVDYQTSDTAGSNGCSVLNGAASSRCDYITTLGSLRFAAGETSKTISIPIIDDARAEGAETFTVTLSAPISTSLGSPSITTVTIADNDASNGTTNPIDDATFFVRQHYIDFLNREPDASGLAFWTNELASCGSNTSCLDVKRVNVSAAFFLSIEFQETGYLVYRIYKSGFGNLSGAPVPVGFTNFLRDTQRIGQGVQVGIGNWEAQLEANKQAFVLAFVQRGDFQTAFPNSLTAAQFVDQLNTNAGGVLSAQERSNLIAGLTTPSDLTQRANVLRAVAEDQTLKAAELNKAFVLMQYFGYLRRDPNAAPDADFGGWQFWLNKLNQFNGDFTQAEMVKAFIVSAEYRQRFAP